MHYSGLGFAYTGTSGFNYMTVLSFCGLKAFILENITIEIDAFSFEWNVKHTFLVRNGTNEIKALLVLQMQVFIHIEDGSCATASVKAFCTTGYTLIQFSMHVSMAWKK